MRNGALRACGLFGITWQDAAGYVRGAINWPPAETYRFGEVTERDEKGLPTILGFSLDVFNGDWDGETVAWLLDAIAATYLDRTPDRMPRSTTVQLAFEFREDPVARRPFVRATTTLPLPPADVVKAAYDAVVVRQEKWARKLTTSQVANQQQPETAVRTWAVGLLAAAGMDTNEAIWRVKERAGGDQLITQERFNQDRRLLVQRFPAAEPYVFRRPRPAPTKGRPGRRPFKGQPKRGV